MQGGVNGKLRELGIGGAIAVAVLYMVFNFLVQIGYVSPATASPSVPVHECIPLGGSNSMKTAIEELTVATRDQSAIMRIVLRSLAPELTIP